MIIESINSPDNLKSLSLDELGQLARELREIIIKRVAVNGGHLASNLGVIELTIALHYIFDSPRDKIIWDVGHQSYAHKLLTGRLKDFHTLRQYNGISGFPKIDESPHDAFGTGHSSTSISAGLGIITARDILKGSRTSNPESQIPNKVVSVIGDGAMTAGLAFEGLNHAGHLKKDIIVILNDNEMSISPNVGALSIYLQRIMTGDLYTRFRKETKYLLERFPGVGNPMLRIAQRAEETVKGFFAPGILFEELGFEYVGPLDGHRIDIMIETFGRFKDFPAPVLIHLITKKGKGYAPAEKNPSLFHGIGPFDTETGTPYPQKKVSYGEILGEYLVELAEDDERIVAITAAMTEGTGLTEFARRFPERFYDVGIAEPHAVTFSAGLAIQGMKPVVAIYSTFLQRAYDEIIHDVCLQNLPVIFAIDRAGIVGEDGPTHHGAFDLSYLRHIPNMVVMAPKDGNELRSMLKTAISYKGPCAIRYPRGSAMDISEYDHPFNIPIGKAELLRYGKDILIIAIGSMVVPSISASEILMKDGINPVVINARFVKPLDVSLISSLAKDIKYILTVEENSILGGFGSAVAEALIESGINNMRIKMLGIPDRFIKHGSQDILRKELSLDSEGIAKEALKLIKG